ncbi:hypothetical protein H5T88_06610 [bacterium]|nr:hypothetical protein [bacterium]
MEYKFTSSCWGFSFWDFPKYCRFMREIGISDICAMFKDANDFPFGIPKNEKAAKEALKIAEDNGVRNTVENQGEDPISALDDVLPFIRFTYFKSVKYQDHSYKKIFAKLLPVYDGYIGLEYEEPSDVAEGTSDDLNYIKNLLNL